MKIRKNKGRQLLTPPSFVWQVIPQGGSYLQKYDAPSLSFIPNRELTPLLLKPSLIVWDPDGIIATGDYASHMSNVSWVLTLMTGSTSTVLPATSGDDVNYSINASTKALTLFYNVPVGSTLHIHFTGDYTDTRRSEPYNFKWDQDLTSEAQTDMNVTLDTGRWKGNIHLSPFKKWGNFGIHMQLKNGPDDIADERATYQWQWWTGSSFSEDFTDCAWLESGEQTKEIVIRQDYVQKIILRCKAYAFDNPLTTQYFVTKIRRWYGQFDYDVEFIRGKYITKDTNIVQLEAWVANGKGLISNPSKYFDMELFFGLDGNLESVGYGEDATIKRSDLRNGEPQCGILLRELTAFMPLLDNDGVPLDIGDGSFLMVQVPTKSREV